MCIANDVGAGANAAVYRYVGDKTLSHYPDLEIAGSWDSNWNNYIKIDCKDYTKGDAMTKRGGGLCILGVGNCN